MAKQIRITSPDGLGNTTQVIDMDTGNPIRCSAVNIQMDANTVVVAQLTTLIPIIDVTAQVAPYCPDCQKPMYRQHIKDQDGTWIKIWRCFKVKKRIFPQRRWRQKKAFGKPKCLWWSKKN